MSFFEDASLVYIPAAIKNGKTYSIKPTDGTGDLTFTRASSATRVGPNGYIEKVRTNYVLQSNTFSDAAWAPTTLTATSGATDPNGGTTAWTIANTAASGIIQQAVTLTGLRTFSIYAKQGTHRYLYMGAYGGTISYATFDLQTGTIPAGSNARIESVGNGWYRCICHSADGTTGGVQILPTDTISSGATTNGNILVWNCQYEEGDIATDYIATTTAAVSVGPVSGTPRLDYLGSDCGRLLLEPQRTNLLTFSEQLNNAAWTQAFLTSSVTANAATSPDGYTNADRISDTTAVNAEFGRGQVFTSTANVPHTISVFLKAGTNNFATLRFYGNNINRYFTAIVDLSTGTITKTQAGTDASATSATITNYGNGWYRVTATATINTTTYYTIVQLANSGTQTIGDFGNVFYTGSGTANILAYGAMAELGAYATSYVPTLGTAVTRVADDCVKTSATSIIGQTEGVIYINWDYKNSGSSGGNVPISLDGGLGNEVYFYGLPNGNYECEMFVSSVRQFIFSGSLGSFGTKKIAIAYKQNDFALYVNGVQIGTDTSGSVPAMNRLYVGRFYGNTTLNIASGVSEVLLFKTRLTNAQLAELTSL
jgi:hypothetical protein